MDENGREDDWLADEGGIDWSGDPRSYEDDADWPQQQPERARPAGLVRAPVRDGTASEAMLRRRRAWAIGAVAAAILIAIIVAVVAANGGGGGSSAPEAVTTQPTSETSVSTPTETTTPTTSTPTSTTAEVTIPEGGHLSAGDSGAQVETLQQALKQLGLYDGKVDGDFGQGTQDAVIAFQNAHNLTADGIVGQETAAAINQALSQSVG